MSVKDRATRIVNTKEFLNCPLPEKVIKIENLKAPTDQYILRMCIKFNDSAVQLPDCLSWVKPLLEKALISQQEKGINHPFIYITVRNGKVKSKTDDQWHLDGFSTRIEHTPEQNYIYTNKYCTEYVKQRVYVPRSLDPLIYNMNTFLDKFVKPENVLQCEENTLYCIDPYVLHRRPSNIPEDFERVFVRISFVPIEINDINNTVNPLLPVKCSKDGVKFRDELKHWNYLK